MRQARLAALERQQKAAAQAHNETTVQAGGFKKRDWEAGAKDVSSQDKKMNESEGFKVDIN